MNRRWRGSVRYKCEKGAVPTTYVCCAVNRRAGAFCAEWILRGGGVFTGGGAVSRVRQLFKRNARAKIVEELLSDLHAVVSGVQLGITQASLALALWARTRWQICWKRYAELAGRAHSFCARRGADWGLRDA